MKQIEKMTQEDRDYFKNGVRTLCGKEVLTVRDIINDPDAKKIFTAEDIAFMNKELGRQAGAVFAQLLRAIKRRDYDTAQAALTGRCNE